MDIVLYGALGPEGQERPAGLCAVEAGPGGCVRPGGTARCGALPRGKPWFPQYPQIHFNLSHTAGAAVCALHDQAVGVDVERLRPPPVHLARGMAAEPFFREWTAREAAVKRRGGSALALRGPFHRSPFAALWRIFCLAAWWRCALRSRRPYGRYAWNWAGVGQKDEGKIAEGDFSLIF